MPYARVILKILRSTLKQGLGEILCRDLVKKVPGKAGRWEAHMEFRETIV